MSSIDPSPATPSPAPPPHRNYLARHWRGELSLPVSYFINGALLTLGFFLLSAGLQRAVEIHLTQVTSLLLVCIVWGFAGIMTVWQLVGIWRAAGSHIDRTGRKFWAVVARCLVVIGVISSISRYATVGLPIIIENVKVARGDVAMGSFVLSTFDGGREIEYSGAIVFGAAEALENKLRETPQAKVVRLTSHGGRMLEARRMLEVIRQARVDTHVPLQCLSACTLVFLGGKNRYMHKDARLGFHASRIDGVSDSEMATENDRVVDLVTASGINRSFATKAYLSPSASMWYPTSQELISAGFVTAVSEGQFSLPDAKFSREEIADILKRTPLYRAIEQHEPAVFRKLIDINIDAMKGGIPENELIARMRVHSSPLTKKYLPHASDETLLLFGRLYIAEMRLVTAKKGAVACHAHVMAEQKFDLALHLSDKEANEYLRMAELAIITGAARAGKQLPAEELELLRSRMWTTLLERHGPTYEADVLKLDTGDGDKRKTCALLESIYAGAMEFPPAQAAALLRYFISES